MRIGIFLEGTPESGGSFQLQMSILDGLRGMVGGGDPELVLFTPHPLALPAEADPADLRTVRLGPPGLAQRAGRRLLRSFRGVPPGLMRRIRTQAQEIIAAHGIDLVYYPSPNMQCLDQDTPYVLTVYDLHHRLHPEFPEISIREKWVARERFYAEAIPRAFATVVATSAHKADVMRVYGLREDRVHVLPYVPGPAVTISSILDAPPTARYGIPPGFLFYPARFWPHKNHAGLLQALRLLREREGLCLPLMLVGWDKGNQPYVCRLAQALGLAEHVFFLGFLSDAEVAALYREALALVMPSFFGPTNLPPLEVFALGCPVVTSDIPGAREQFGNAAILVNPKDPADIARGIRLLHEDPALRKEMIRRGQEVVARWGVADYARGLAEIFESFSPIRRCWAGS